MGSKSSKYLHRHPEMKIITVIGLVIFLACGTSCGKGSGQIPVPVKAVKFNSNDKVLILAPHPDDEVLGCGGIIQQALRQNIPVQVVFLTYGDFNDWSFMIYRRNFVIAPSDVEKMGLVRHDEAVAADTFLGIKHDSIVFLGYPDFGTLNIMESHWLPSAPYKSILTQAEAVPYQNAQRPGAPYTGDDLLTDLKKVILDFKPTKIFVSHPADQHPDHQALYLFTKIALWDLNLDPEPEVTCYLVHFSHWPVPRGLHESDSIIPPTALSGEPDWTENPLTPSEVSLKHNALELHKTQMDSNPEYLLSFIRSNELFGDMPPVSLPMNPNERNLLDLSSGPPPSAPEQLTGSERNLFLGFEKSSVKLSGDGLVLDIGFSRPLAAGVNVSIYFFGYKQGVPFSSMPKIHVKLDALVHNVFSQELSLPNSAVSVARTARDIRLTVPLQLIGDPDRLLFGSRIYSGEVPMNWLAWQEVDFRTQAAAQR